MAKALRLLAALIAAVGALFAFKRIRRGRKDEEPGGN